MGEGEEGKIMAAKEALEKALKTPNYTPVYRTRGVQEDFGGRSNPIEPCWAWPS